jgi:hypothetical protein
MNPQDGSIERAGEHLARFHAFAKTRVRQSANVNRDLSAISPAAREDTETNPG